MLLYQVEYQVSATVVPVSYVSFTFSPAAIEVLGVVLVMLAYRNRPAAGTV